MARPPQIRRDAVGAFEARLRRNARWRWLGPALVVLALAAILAAWLLFSRRQGPVTERLRTEGLALVALDDAASLDQAVARFDESLQVAPRGREAEADRALAQVLRATALLEDGEALAARAAMAQAADRAAAAGLAQESTPAASQAPLAATAPAPSTANAGPSPATPAAALSPETARLQAEARDRAARGTELSRKAQQALQKLEAEKVAVLEVSRALALQHAAAGEREAAQKYLATGRGRAADDPWLGLAEATLDVRARDRAGRERGVTELSALAARHPELLRARYLLAAAQATLGRRGDAQAAVDGILAANPRHERAEALRAELARAPIAPASPAQAAAGTLAAPGNGATAPRNAASQPAVSRAVATPSGAPAPSGGAAPRTARDERGGTAAPVPAGIGGAPSAGRKPPSGAAPAAASTPTAARPAPLRPRPRPAPEARPVEFGAGN